MADTRWVLELSPLPPVPGEPPAEVRVRAALKTLLRRYRLRCVEVRGPPPDPTAWFVYVRSSQTGRWEPAHSHATEEGARALLAEDGREGVVLPKGQQPPG